MRYLKRFNESKEDIDSICRKYSIVNYNINKDGLVDVEGDVDLYNKGLTKLPLKFGYVSGYFNCNNNQLTSLEGSPQSVGEDFYCISNQLTSLKGGPQSVGGYFECRRNKLTSLEGSPKSVGSEFYCSENELTSLEGCTENIAGSFNCDGNPIYKWWEMVGDKSKIEIFNYLDINSEYPDEENEIKIKEIIDYDKEV